MGGAIVRGLAKIGILEKRWSGFPRQYEAGLKWCAAPVHIASLAPGSVLQ